MILRDLLIDVDYDTRTKWRKLAESILDISPFSGFKSYILASADYITLSKINKEDLEVIWKCMDSLESVIENLLGNISTELIRAVGYEYISFIGKQNGIVNETGEYLCRAIWNYYICEECDGKFDNKPICLDNLPGKLWIEYEKLGISTPHLMENIDAELFMCC